jgi:hypothetical protein
VTGCGHGLLIVCTATPFFARVPIPIESVEEAIRCRNPSADRPPYGVYS